MRFKSLGAWRYGYAFFPRKGHTVDPWALLSLSGPSEVYNPYWFEGYRHGPCELVRQYTLKTNDSKKHTDKFYAQNITPDVISTYAF